MAVIEIEGMEFYAYHGHFKTEQIVGNRFIADLSVETDIQKAAKSDCLNDTIDYQQLYKIIEEEMQVTSNLIEHVSHRILSRIKQNYPKIKTATLRLSKLNPPLNGKTQKVSIVSRF